MFDAIGAIGDALGAIGDFFSSIIQMISYLINFVYTCISECIELLTVIPQFVASLFTAAIVFIVILACKRAILD